ncbi:MAG: hypothetical protein KatS3mg061_1035 [Dehalococcoidia bacterium]|nr:MAG: hypothetical protein KatS3mg061_1035 [Dehalococcoidia bacterium]
MTVGLLLGFLPLAPAKAGRSPGPEHSAGFPQPATGTVAGTVRAGDTNAPLGNVPVQVRTLGGVVQAATTTDGSGAYSLPSLPAGSYLVQFGAVGNYAQVWAFNQPSPALANTVTVTGGQTTTVNALLPRGGTLTGSVVGSDGPPLANVFVEVTDKPSPTLSYFGFTDNSGVFTLTQIISGSYRVRLVPPPGYLPEYYHDQPTIGTATPVTVTSAQTTTLSATVQRAAVLSGTVTDAHTAQPLDLVTVRVYNLSHQVVRQVATDVNGQYLVPNLDPGPYRLEFSAAPPYPGAYFYNSQTLLAFATVVTATAGMTLTINQALPRTGQVVGRVTGEDAPTIGLAGVSVSLFSAGQVPAGTVTTDAGGYFTITGVTSGTWTVQYDPQSPSPYLRQYYRTSGRAESFAQASFFSVPYSGTVIANATLALGGAVSGRVIDGRTSEGISGVTVWALRLDNLTERNALSGPNGAFTLAGLPTGAYLILFEPLPPYSVRYYPSASQPSLATPVVVTAGATVPITGVLSAGTSTLTGQVTAATTGAGLSASLRLYNASGALVRTLTSDPAGFYAFTDLPGGHYLLRATADTFPTVWFSGKPTRQSADVITLAEGQRATANLVLPEPGTVRGQVTAADTGLPLGNVAVRLLDAAGNEADFVTTDANGQYAFLIAPGRYRLRVTPPTVTPYAQQYANGKPTLGDSDLIVVASGMTTVVNAALERGGTLTGLVTARDTGQPLSGLEVRVFDRYGQLLRTETTLASGVYSVTGLPAGSYFLGFNRPNAIGQLAAYGVQYANDQPTLATATPIGVGMGTVSTVNASLPRRGQVTGRVTAADSGVGLAGVAIRFLPVAGGEIFAVTTDLSGYYTATTVLSGSYRIQARPPGFGPGREYAAVWAPDRPSENDAAVFTITDGAQQTLNVALPRGGMVAGRVLAPDGLIRVSSDVTLVAADGSFVTAQVASPETNGWYTFTNVLPGTYKLLVEPFLASGYAPQYAFDRPTQLSADLLAVSAGNVTLAHITVRPLGAVGGRVFAADTGQPIANVPVWLRDASGSAVNLGMTNASGYYSITTVFSGSYLLSFGPSGRYPLQYYQGSPTLAGARPVAIPHASNVVIDAQLSPGVALSGRVTAQDTGAPLARVLVSAFTGGVGTLTLVTSQETDPTGAFTLTVPAQTALFLRFLPPTSGNAAQYAQQWYGGAASSAGATSILPQAGMPPLNVQLPLGGTISGQVTGGSAGAASLMSSRGRGPLMLTGTGIPWVRVEVLERSQQVIATGFTDGAGYYAVTQLPVGEYFLRFVPPTGASGSQATFWTRQYSGGAYSLPYAQSVVVRAGQITLADAVLRPGGGIQGRVTASNSGFGLGEVTVTALSRTGEAFASTTTGPEGTYLLLGLPPQDWYLRFDPPTTGPASAYAGRFFAGSTTLDQAAPVPVQVNQLSTADVVLPFGFRTITPLVAQRAVFP